MKCEICNKKQKENTDGNSKYCQGHDMFEVQEIKATDFARSMGIEVIEV